MWLKEVLGELELVHGRALAEELQFLDAIRQGSQARDHQPLNNVHEALTLLEACRQTKTPCLGYLKRVLQAREVDRKVKLEMMKVGLRSTISIDLVLIIVRLIQ